MVSINQVINELLTFEEINYQILDWIQEKYPDEIECANGCYKFCIISKSWDKVIKIDQPDECGNCATEADMYEIGKKYGIEEILLELTYIGELVSGQQIYLQEKADYIHCELTTTKVMQYTKETVDIPFNEIRQLSNKLYSSHLNFQWLAKLMITYDKEFIKRFIKWQKETRQNDLHSANIGYRFDKPVILDYAVNESWFS